MKSLKYNLLLTLFFYSSIFFSQEKNQNIYNFKWDNGFKIESVDKQFQLNFGGRIMIDHAYFSQDNGLDVSFPLTKTVGTEIRRARIFTSGSIYENVDFSLSIDFGGDAISVKDAYIGLKNIPILGNIRVGHIKEPFILDILTSSKYTTFMERSFILDFFQIRNNGVLLFNDFFDKKLSLQFGYFLNEDNSSTDTEANNGFAVTTRATTLAINKKEELLHLGLSHSYRKPDSKEYQISDPSNGHLSKLKYIFTGPISNIKNVNLTNLETAYVKNSFAFQGEYLTAKINTDLVNSYTFSTYYTEISYFLTGESRNFKSSYKGFGRISPKNNFGKNGSGAWELALRYSNSDLTDKDILGGEQTNIVLGLNWYLNPSTRILFNNVFANVKNQGKATVFQFRFQIDF